MTIAIPVRPGILRAVMRYLPLLLLLFLFSCATNQEQIQPETEQLTSRALVAGVCQLEPAESTAEPVDLVKYLDAHATPNQTSLAPLAPPLVNLGGKKVMARFAHDDDWGESSRLLCNSVRTMERVEERSCETDCEDKSLR